MPAAPSSVNVTKPTTTTTPPKATKKSPPKKPAPTPTPPKAVEPEKVETNGEATREVVYDDVVMDRYDTKAPNGPITPQLAKDILYWETEKEYGARMVGHNPGTKVEHWVWKDEYLLQDASKYTRKGDRIILQGDKVKCQNNLDNRELDIEWSLGLAQTILTGKWAGPFTGRKTVNGSTIVISETGKVESGQHQLIAVIIADQLFQANPEAYPFWKVKVDSGATYTANGETHKVVGPFIETIVVTGISEDPDVTMTVDNCRQRTAADVFYTSPLYRNMPTGDRREYSRMTSAAIDLLWERTDAKGYKTLPEIVGFQERHKKMLKCVEHLFQENPKEGRPINLKARLTGGQASALCYLMACSAPETDGDVYRNGLPPTEKDLDWSRYDKAREFWAMIGNHEKFKVVREALAKLIDSSTDDPTNIGLGGRLAEKLAIIAKAWDVFVAYDSSTGADMFNPADLLEGGALHLAYSDLDAKGNKLPDGQLVFNDRADFHGIDCPVSSAKTLAAPEPPAPTPEQQEAIKAALRKEQALKVLKLRGTVVKK